MSSTERPINCEIVEVKPIIFGGSPTDPVNKTLLTREQHIKYVTYWNRVLAGVRDPSTSGKH
jgi:hypothetical protein